MPYRTMNRDQANAVKRIVHEATERNRPLTFNQLVEKVYRGDLGWWRSWTKRSVKELIDRRELVPLKGIGNRYYLFKGASIRRSRSLPLRMPLNYQSRQRYRDINADIKRRFFSSEPPFNPWGRDVRNQVRQLVRRTLEEEFFQRTLVA